MSIKPEPLTIGLRHNYTSEGESESTSLCLLDPGGKVLQTILDISDDGLYRYELDEEYLDIFPTDNSNRILLDH